MLFGEPNDHSSEPEELFDSHHQTQCKCGDHDFADGSHGERAQTLFAHVAEVRAKADACEGKKESPTRKIGERTDLVFVEELEGGEHRDEKETQDELGKLLPEERGLVANCFSLALTGPVDRVCQHNETDHSVARGFHENGQFARGVRVESAGGGCFGGVIDGKSRPNAIGPVSKMQSVANQRKYEKRERAERKNRGNRKRGIFLVGLNRALRGNNGADAADGGADGEERSQFRLKV